MSKRIGFSILLLLGLISAKAQQQVPSVDSLRKHVYYLASDELKGRKTGELGLDLAAGYIKNRFQSYGLAPLSGDSYYFPYQLVRNHKTNAMVKCQENILFWPWHLYFVSNYRHNDTLINKLVFVGFGTDAELSQLSIEGKCLAILANSPQEAYLKIVNIQKKHHILTFFVLFEKKNLDVEKAWGIDYQLGNYALMDDYENDKLKRITEPWAQPTHGDSVNIFYCFPNVFQNVFKKTDRELTSYANDNLKQSGQLLKSSITPELEIYINYSDSTEVLNTENVGGFIRGKDTTQTIIVSAHFDHLGEEYGQIYHGADDNASGTAALLEDARLMAIESQHGNIPERNVLFLAFSGEELGLLGSKAFVYHPTLPLNQVVLNVNMDMIGRWDERHESDKNFVYLLTVGSHSRQYFRLGKSELDLPKGFTVSKNPGTKEKLTFKYGSDHYNFLTKGVPVAVFFTGLHSDYHTPNDIADRINYQNLTTITGMAHQYILEVANNKNRYPLTKHH